MTTVAKAITEIQTDVVKYIKKKEQERSVLEMLPVDIENPLISNLDSYLSNCNGWITFKGHEIFKTLEAVGWKLHPATLVGRDNYSPLPEPYAFDDVPEHKYPHRNDYKLKDAWHIVPMWIDIPYRSSPELECYMQAPDERIFKIQARISPAICNVQAAQENYKGGWHFVTGTAKLIHKDSLDYINSEAGETLATIHSQSRAYISTQQSISGALYWEPNVENIEWVASDIAKEICCG